MDWILNRPIAHRGLHNNDLDIPEHSDRAFQAAIENNYPVELDIRLLADGELAVFHDADLFRMTGIKEPISQHCSRSIKQFKLLAGDRDILLLDEVFELINGKVPILIEIKSDRAVGKLEQILLTKLANYAGEYAIQSFNPVSLAWFKANSPSILRGQLSTDFKNINFHWYKKFLHKNLLINWLSSPHFIAYDLHCLPYFPVTVLRQVWQVPLLAWTVSSEADKIKALKYADNLIFENILP